MSFIRREDIQQLVEGLVARLWQQCRGQDVGAPFPRMSYEEAMTRCGSVAWDNARDAGELHECDGALPGAIGVRTLPRAVHGGVP